MIYCTLSLLKWCRFYAYYGLCKPIRVSMEEICDAIWLGGHLPIEILKVFFARVTWASEWGWEVQRWAKANPRAERAAEIRQSSVQTLISSTQIRSSRFRWIHKYSSAVSYWPFQQCGVKGSDGIAVCREAGELYWSLVSPGIGIPVRGSAPDSNHGFIFPV